MKMKAIVCPRYGSPEVLQLVELEKPTPKANEVLIKIHAANVSAGDTEIRSFKMPRWLWLLARLGFGIRGPRKKILGQELSGEIEAVGEAVTRFQPGDQIFAATGWNLGAYAEFVCLTETPEDGAMIQKPRNMSYEEATAIPVGGIEALHFLRLGDIQTGEKILINGAGGSIGTIAVQLGKHYGAEVTAVDRAEKLSMLSSLGADHVIDYLQEDFTQAGKTYNVIFDVVGKSSFTRSIRILEPSGRYLIANPGLSQMIRGAWTSRRTDKKVVVTPTSYKDEDLEYLKDLIETGKIKAVIDRRFTLEQMADAHRYVESGQKSGNVIAVIRESSE